jgi:serine/threonine protein kinase
LCAIKEMSLSKISPEEQAQAIKNFNMEAKMLWSLDHRYFPAVIQFFAENQRYFLVMEYIDGATLEDLLERNQGPFSERRILGWAEQLCEALEYLHSQNPPIIFRDMKPGNIMLTRQGKIKLIDFGIARFFRPAHGVDTQTLGTPGYAPPEQYGTAQTDERSDIYSLGMTLHHLLTNQFSESGFGAKACDMRAVNPLISVSVARALEKATALERSDRFQSVEAFRQALLNGGAFAFETGESAFDIEMLADLCARYPLEAAEYLASGEIASWLQEIQQDELAEDVSRIRVMRSHPQMAVEEFLRAVRSSGVQSSGLSRGYSGNGRRKTQWPVSPVDNELDGVLLSSPHLNGSSRSHGSDRHTTSGSSAFSPRSPRKYENVVTVKPKTLDFGVVYSPEVSAPLKIVIDGAQGLPVKGSIQALEPWISLDQTAFDGVNAYVNVQIRTSQLKSYSTYRGEVVITPEGGTPVSVTIDADVQGYLPYGYRSGKTISPDEEEDYGDLDISKLSSIESQMMQILTNHEEEHIVALDPEAVTKYGPPNETIGGWDAAMLTARQQRNIRYGSTFALACMMGALWYTFLVSWVHIPVLPHASWFVAFLAGIIPLSPLGTMFVERPRFWFHRETCNRLMTGVCGSLLVLGPVNALLQIVAGLIGFMGILHLLVALALTALAATYSTHPLVSKTIWSRILLVCQQAKYIHGAVVFVAAISGVALGYLLTVGTSLGLFTGFGMLIGASVAAIFIGRLNHLLKLARRP